ncbi:hypothetical protein PMIN04_005075 [Paraphaeosphaeria minitans]
MENMLSLRGGADEHTFSDCPTRLKAIPRRLPTDGVIQDLVRQLQRTPLRSLRPNMLVPRNLAPREGKKFASLTKLISDLPNGMRTLDSKDNMYRCMRLPSMGKFFLRATATVSLPFDKTLCAASWYGINPRTDASGNEIPIIQALKPDPTPGCCPDQAQTTQEQDHTPPDQGTGMSTPCADPNFPLAASLVAGSKKSKSLANLVLAINFYLEDPKSRLDLYAKAIEDYNTSADFRRDDSTQGFDDHVMNEYQRLLDQQRVLAQFKESPAKMEPDVTSLNKSNENLQNVIKLTHVTLYKKNVCLDDVATLNKAI